jgi:hypothetical protein
MTECTAKSVNGIYGNSNSLLLELYETHCARKLQISLMLKQVVHIITAVP